MMICSRFMIFIAIVYNGLSLGYAQEMPLSVEDVLRDKYARLNGNWVAEAMPPIGPVFVNYQIGEIEILSIKAGHVQSAKVKEWFDFEFESSKDKNVRPSTFITISNRQATRAPFIEQRIRVKIFLKIPVYKGDYQLRISVAKNAPQNLVFKNNPVVFTIHCDGELGPMEVDYLYDVAQFENAEQCFSLYSNIKYSRAPNRGIYWNVFLLNSLIASRAISIAKGILASEQFYISTKNTDCQVDPIMYVLSEYVIECLKFYNNENIDNRRLTASESANIIAGIDFLAEGSPSSYYERNRGLALSAISSELQDIVGKYDKRMKALLAGEVGVVKNIGERIRNIGQGETANNAEPEKPNAGPQ